MKRLLASLLLFGLLLMTGSAASGQTVRSRAAEKRTAEKRSSKKTRIGERNHFLSIENGRVLLDGNEIPRSELPASLDPTDISATLRVSGNSLIEINGIMYQLENDSFTEADGDESGSYNVMVFFDSTQPEAPSVRVLNPESSYVTGIGFTDGPYDVVMKNYVGKLNEKAAEFGKLHALMSSGKKSQRFSLELAQQLQLEAENTARIASAFPRVEYEGYLRGIHENDSELYNRLVEEHDLEMITHEIASQARATIDETQRKALAKQLRAQLERIFQLKQKNREDEINQLSLRLQDLTELMNKRVALKDRIIESRLKELLGELDWEY